MNKIKLVSQDEKVSELSVELDLAAQRRLKTIIGLAIAIGRRGGLISSNGGNTAIEAVNVKEGE